MDYYMGGAPCRDYIRSVWAGIKDSLRNRVTITFDEAFDYLYKELESDYGTKLKMEDMRRKSVRKDPNKVEWKLPVRVENAQRLRKLRDQHRSRPGGGGYGNHHETPIHHIRVDPDNDYMFQPPDYDTLDAIERLEDEHRAYEDEHEPQRDEEEGGYETAGEEREREDDDHGQGANVSEAAEGVNAAVHFEVTDAEFHDMLLEIKNAQTGRRVCFEFARTGKCKWLKEKGTCTFSHEQEDVDRFNNAEKLGPKGMSMVARTYNTYRSHTPAYQQGPKGTSPGVRAPFRPSGGGPARPGAGTPRKV
jgi:hypothetical protein